MRVAPERENSERYCSNSVPYDRQGTENSFTVANVLISGAEMGVIEVHEVNIKSNLINGNIVIGMRPSLPVEGISLILGNDIAGEIVMVDPRVVEKRRDDEKTERLAEKFPGIFPACVQ